MLAGGLPCLCWSAAGTHHGLWGLASGVSPLCPGLQVGVFPKLGLIWKAVQRGCVLLRFPAQLLLRATPRAGFRPSYFRGHTWPGRVQRRLPGDQLQPVIMPVSQISTLGPSKVTGEIQGHLAKGENVLGCEPVLFPSRGAYHCTARPLSYGCLWASVLMAARLQSARLFVGCMLHVFSSGMLPNTLPGVRSGSPLCPPGNLQPRVVVRGRASVGRGFPSGSHQPPCSPTA